MKTWNPIQLTFQLPPLRDEATAQLAALEALVPPVQLAWRGELTGREKVRFTHLLDRDAWVRERLIRGQDVHLFSGPDEPPVNVHLMPLATTARDGSQSALAAVWLPENVAANGRLQDLMADAGDALSALHSSYMPLASGARSWTESWSSTPLPRRAQPSCCRRFPRWGRCLGSPESWQRSSPHGRSAG